MARLPRLSVAGGLHHLIQRCHEGSQLFRDEEDYQMFLNWLKQGIHQFRIALHAYVLMPDHLHLLMTPEDSEGIGKLMQWLGRHYVPYFNHKYQRQGGLWQGRYRATVLEAESYFINCSLLIESNPVRRHLCDDAADYPWSSYQHHIGQRRDPLVSEHPIFWAMGNTPFQREANYRQQMEQSLSRNMIQQINEATNKAWVLGSDQFKAELARQTERRVAPGVRGRPRKAIS